MDVEFGGYNIGMERGGVVVLKDHDARWAPCFRRVADLIRVALEPYNMELRHIGSTSIPGIKAKPILDILGVVEDMEAFERQRPKLEHLRFVWKGENGIPDRRYCVLHNAEKTVGYLHFHTFHRGNPEADAHILFRDYLRAFEEKAKQYEKLKEALAVIHASERDKYTSAKDALVQTLLREAQAWKQATDPNTRLPLSR